RREVKERFRLDGERQLRPQQPRQQFAARLDGSLRPPVLLTLERVHLDRYFGRRDEVGQEHEPPAAQLRAVTEVEILGERVVLPAAGVLDRRAAPDTRGAVEIEEAAAAVAAAVLQHEMPVEQDGLNFR